MLSVHDASVKIAGYIAGQTGEAEKNPIYTYGMEIILGTVIKFGLILALAMVTGILKPTFLIIFIAAGFRILSGGVHCSAYYRCLICGLVVFLSLGYMVQLASPLMAMSTLKFFTLTGFILTLLITICYAPVDTERKLITETAKRMKMKMLSIIFVFTLYCFILLIDFNKEVTLPFLVGLIWQAFTLTPAGDWVMKKADGMLTVS